jgi:hypothetical protein
MFDLKEFLNSALINTAVLMPVIMALVTLYGKFGAQGKVQLALSLVTGFVLGVAVMVADLGVPADFAGWLALVIYGLIPGLVASGVYETGKGIAARAAQSVG